MPATVTVAMETPARSAARMDPTYESRRANASIVTPNPATPPLNRSCSGTRTASRGSRRAPATIPSARNTSTNV